MQESRETVLRAKGLKGSNEKQVFGIPGAGKTTYLSKKIGDAAQKIGGESLIVSSFTRTAAKELVSRELPVPSENIGTLHALCYRMIGRPELAEKHIAEFNKEYPDCALSAQKGIDVDDPTESLATIAKDNPNDYRFAKIQVRRAQLFPLQNWPDDEVYLYQRWERFKYMNSYVDFTDMIDICLRDKIAPPPGVRAGVFDEAQDFTPMQLELIRQWGRDHLEYILVCGDDDQCLFTFLGATPDVFLNPDVGDDQKIFLERSYRVPGKVQAKADAWISQLGKHRVAKRQFPRTIRGTDVVDEGHIYRPKPTLGGYRMTWNRGKLVMEYVEKMLKIYPENETIMLLASCGYMLNPTISYLRAAGIPYSNRFRPQRRDWNPLRPSRGVSTARRLYSFLKPSWGEFGGYLLWTAAETGQWIDLCDTKKMLKKGGKKTLLAAAAQSQISRDEFMNIVFDVFEPTALDAALELNPSWLRAHCLKNKADALEFPMAINERLGANALIAEPRVTVGTIHSVKGGEADHVVLFPDLSLNASVEAKSGESGRHAIIRLFYVGMTRCRHSLHIPEPDGNLHVPI